MPRKRSTAKSTPITISVPNALLARIDAVTGEREDGAVLTRTKLFLRGVLPLVETLERTNGKMSDRELLMRKDAHNAKALRRR
jgi:hypothetical protein